MCLIVYSQEGKSMSKEVFFHAGGVNPDGVGVMCRNEVVKFLGHKSTKRAWKYIQQKLVPNNIPYGIHWRWATHGDITYDNCHPFETKDGHFLMHNGVLGKATAASTAEFSDTAVYVRDHLQSLPEGMEGDEYFKALEADIGYGNKFLIMSKEGVFKIVNERAGDTFEGFWYSNTYSLPNSLTAKIRKAGWSTTTAYGHTHWGSNYYDGDYTPSRRTGRWNYETKKWEYDTEDSKSTSSYGVTQIWDSANGKWVDKIDWRNGVWCPETKRWVAKSIDKAQAAASGAEVPTQDESNWKQAMRRESDKRPVQGGVHYIAGKDGRIRVVEGSNTDSPRIRNATEQERKDFMTERDVAEESAYQTWLETAYKNEEGMHDTGHTPSGTRAAVALAVRDIKASTRSNPHGFDFSPAVIEGLKELGYMQTVGGGFTYVPPEKPVQLRGFHKETQVPGGDFAPKSEELSSPTIDEPEIYEEDEFKAALKALARSIHI